ncbi:N-acetylmuramoyl-L-alanine amidase-like domain-containing protein [Vibrio pectenicida]|nr:N-acetylmuramoyl-L-alanine amidase-like domain-containing protein [Vibrio pectenicida]
MKMLSSLFAFCFGILTIHQACSSDNDPFSEAKNNEQSKLFSDYAKFYTEAQEHLENIINSNVNSDSKKIEQLSSVFVDVPYVANQLIGDHQTKEQLVIKFGELDCFTYLDYVEALRKSDHLEEFKYHLIQTRYIEGKIHFLNRRHFFSDWVNEETYNATDVTTELSNLSISVVKKLNQKTSGGVYLVGLPIKERTISYIPSDNVDETVLQNMQNGDYVGAYTDIAGLDVTHTGIFIQTDNGPVYRNASSKRANNRVVDTPFLDYIKTIPGIVVYRAVD